MQRPMELEGSLMFRDRRDAGVRLGRMLREIVGPNVLVVGLTRGGVPVAHEVAHKLRAPLDVLVVRKLGVPGHEELAMGAVGPGGTRVLNDRVVSLLGISQDIIDSVTAREEAVILARERAYRRDRPPERLRGRHVVVVDDGLATGATMRAAIACLRASGAQQVTVAVPVGAPESCEELRRDADEVVCMTAPEWLHAIGEAYDDFPPVSDDEVRELLDRGGAHAGLPGAPR